LRFKRAAVPPKGELFQLATDFLAGLVVELDLDWFRKRAGGIVNSRLKARLNAASDSYPTSAAIWDTE